MEDGLAGGFLSPSRLGLAGGEFDLGGVVGSRSRAPSSLTTIGWANMLGLGIEELHQEQDSMKEVPNPVC